VFCPSGGAPDGAKCATSPAVGMCLGSQAIISLWIDEELAHVAFGGRAIFYDGGQRDVLTESEWQAKYVLPQKLG
jgi:hypothetical protein